MKWQCEVPLLTDKYVVRDTFKWFIWTVRFFLR